MKHLACVLALLVAPLFQEKLKPAPFKPDPTANLVVHEWGVAACVAGSDKQLVGASGPADDDLPAFITKLPELGMGRGMSVRQPIIYITAEKPTDFSCRVRFSNGYPTCFDPPTLDWANTRDWKKPGEGFVGWTGKVDPAGAGKGPEVPAGHWIEKCRNVDSSPLTVQGRSEKYLFYEGVVSIPCPVTIEEAQDAGIAVKSGDWKAPSMAVLVKNGKAQTFDISGAAKELSIEQMLIDAGLNRREAAALLGIWDAHFMKRDGLRLLTLLTGDAYDQLLPIEVCPKPVEMKRVLVLCVDYPTADLKARVDDLVKGLGAAEIEERQEASKKIFALGPIAATALAGHSTHEDPEVRAQVGAILEKFKGGIPVPKPGPRPGGLKRINEE